MQLDIFLINSIIPLMLAFVLWVNGSRDTKAKRFLSLAMVNAGVSFFITHQYMNGNYSLYVILHPVGVSTILFIYPSFYQYVSYLTGQTRFHYRVFLPGAVFGVLSCVVFWGLLNAKEQVYFLSDYRTHPSSNTLKLQINQWFRLANVGLLFFQIGWFYFKTNGLLKKYHMDIASVFSDASHLQLSRVKILNISFIIAAFACVSFYLMNPVKVFGTIKALEYPFYVLAFILSLLGAIGVSQSEAPVVMQGTLENDTPQEAEQNIEKIEDELFKRINTYLQNDKPYLDPDFNIVQLSSVVGSNRTYVSNCINRHRGMNFSQYTNSFRLAFAKQLLTTQKEMPVAEIAVHSGFGSVSAFSRTFKENVKMTPSEFKESTNHNAVTSTQCLLPHPLPPIDLTNEQCDRAATSTHCEPRSN